MLAVAGRLIKIGIGILAAWLVGMLAIGVIYGGRVGDRVASRVADSLVAEASVESSTLALIRGHVVLEHLKVKKDDLGVLTVDVDSIRCELPPLGVALVDRECRDVIVKGVRLEATAAAVFQLKRPKRGPMNVRHVVIDDAVLTFAPSAFVPGIGRISIRIDHAEAGATAFKTPLSWIFSLTALDATIELPAGITVKLGYKDGMLTAAGGLFGATPVKLPVAIPIPQSADDAKEEIKKLVVLGKDLAEQLVARRAEDWLRQKLTF